MRKFTFPPRAIIFDMDGVIIDSMPYHFLAWYEALRPYGVRVSCFDVYSKEGERWDKTLKDLLRQAQVEPTKRTLEKIFLRRQKIFKKYFKRFIFSQAEDFLKCLEQKGYLLGLVTGTPMQEIKQILPEHIIKLFNCIISGEKVRHGKPHPEPYLKAARGLRTEPRRCIVIENAPLGIQSAKKAGMFCVAVTTSLPKEYLKEADIVVEELSQITEIIDKTCVIRNPKKFS